MYTSNVDAARLVNAGSPSRGGDVMVYGHIETFTLQTLAPPGLRPNSVRDTRDVLHTRVMPSADCYIDHRLVRCKVASAFKSPPKRKGPRTKKLQVHELHDRRVKNNLEVMLEERLHCVTAAEPEEQRKQMKTILQ